MSAQNTALFSTERWHTPAAYDVRWHSRIELMVEYLPSETRSVVDFGCGDRFLAQLLPDVCAYISIDSHKNMGADMQLDLNELTASDALPDADLAFLSGVIEYLTDFPFFLALFPYRTVIAHYSYASPLKARELFSRRSHGWVNHYTVSELLRIFESAGYRLDLAVSRYPRQEIILRLVISDKG